MTENKRTRTHWCSVGKCQKCSGKIVQIQNTDNKYLWRALRDDNFIINLCECLCHLKIKKSKIYPKKKKY